MLRFNARTPIALLLSLLLVACGGGGGSTGNGAQKSFTGVARKGPCVEGTGVTFHELDASGATAGQSVSGSVDSASGGLSFCPPEGWNGNIEIVVGGLYVDESRAINASDALTLTVTTIRYRERKSLSFPARSATATRMVLFG